MNTSKSKSTKTSSSKTRATTRPGQDVRSLFERLKRGGESNDTLKKSMIVAKLYRKHNMVPEAIAEKSNISTAHIYNMLKIEGMPPKIIQFIQEGRIQATDALKLARKQPNEKAFIAVVEKFIKQRESSPAAHIDAAILRKEQTFQQNKVIDSRLKTKVEKLLSSVAPDLSAYKMRLYTNMITRTISAVV